jgi:probable phosphoglycerate mutase
MEQTNRQTTTLYLVRHGETEENAQHILQGHLPGKLSAQGVEQVCALREELKQTHFDRMVCSDLQRCIDTAQLLNERLHLSLTTTPLLRERDWGSFTGRLIPEIQQTPFPEDVESVEAMRARAAEFLQMIRKEFPGETVLAVGHGLMNRAIQSVFYRKEMKEIPRMSNAEVRKLEWEEE